MCFIISVQAFADGNAVDKIYHPYVDALEFEVEYRSVFENRKSTIRDLKQIHQLSFGSSFGQSLFGEMKVVGAKPRNAGFDLNGFELELKWQMTEQGEYGADFGLLLEYEKEFGRNEQEMAVGVLLEKEIGRWSGTANVFLIHEWGVGLGDDYETAVALQARYRFSRAFEPALELYTGKDSVAIGPVVLGSASVGIRKSLNWEAGVIFGVAADSPDTTVRFLIEFEF